MVNDMNADKGDADCVLLLICKLKPFVTNMQNAVDERIVGAVDNTKNGTNHMNIFFKFVPTLQEYKRNGMECEELYKKCKLF